jgi:hypothetical protein
MDFKFDAIMESFILFIPLLCILPVPAVAWSKAPTAIMGSNSTGGLKVCLLCVFVLSGRGLCDELITRPEESYWLWRVDLCNQESSWYE